MQARVLGIPGPVRVVPAGEIYKNGLGVAQSKIIVHKDGYLAQRVELPERGCLVLASRVIVDRHRFVFLAEPQEDGSALVRRRPVEVGGLATGGMGVGYASMGGLAVGHYALGGAAFGNHAIDGTALANPDTCDPAAVDFFSAWLDRDPFVPARNQFRDGLAGAREAARADD